MNSGSKYEILVSQSARKDLKRIPRAQASTIVRKLIEFGETGRGDTVNIRENLWRLRVGDYRIFFHAERNQVRVLRIIHRKVAYRLDIIESLIERIHREKEE